MNTPQHTPTPWVVKGESIESGGKPIASVWAPRRADETRLEDESWLDMRTRTKPERDAIEAEMYANAMLIASAPDLLAERERFKVLNAALVAALQRVAAWELPDVMCEDGKIRSFTVEYGSNGAREFFRTVAHAALTAYGCKP